MFRYCCIISFHVINHCSFCLLHSTNILCLWTHCKLKQANNPPFITPGRDCGFSTSTSCDRRKLSGCSASFSTHLGANAAGSGHAVQEVEEECLVSSLETTVRGKREEDTWSAAKRISVLVRGLQGAPEQLKTILSKMILPLSFFLSDNWVSFYDAAGACDFVTNYFAHFSENDHQQLPENILAFSYIEHWSCKIITSNCALV